VATVEEQRALLEFCRRHRLWLLADEVYERIYFGAEDAPVAPSILRLCTRDDAVLVAQSFSKSYCMTGWRVGFLAAPPAVAKAVASLKSHLTSNVSTPAQHAALGALAAGEGHTRRMFEAFARRRELARERLLAIPGLQLTPPDGAFYVFPRVDTFYGGEVDGSLALCKALLDEARLAAVPGAAFGEDRCIRLSIAAAEDVLTEGLGRLAGFLQRAAAKVG